MKKLSIKISTSDVRMSVKIKDKLGNKSNFEILKQNALRWDIYTGKGVFLEHSFVKPYEALEYLTLNYLKY